MMLGYVFRKWLAIEQHIVLSDNLLLYKISSKHCYTTRFQTMEMANVHRKHDRQCL